MFEYKDNFLMGQAVDCCEAAANHVSCNIKHEAAEEFDELARLVGEGATLESENDDNDIDEAALPSWTEITEADAPRLEFDLEDELTRAFDGRQVSDPDQNLGPDFGARALQDALEASEPEHSGSEVESSPVAVEPETEVIAVDEEEAVLATQLPPAPSATEPEAAIAEEHPVFVESAVTPVLVSEPETLSFDSSESAQESGLSGMVSQEIEKALNEFDENADDQPLAQASFVHASETEAIKTGGNAEVSEESLEDFSMELARLMGEPDTQDSEVDTSPDEVATPPVPPTPTEAVMPWEAPEIVAQTTAAEVLPAPDEPARQASAFQTSYTPPSHFPDAAPLEVPELESSAQVDDVLARADAVEAAAVQDAALDDGLTHDLEAALSRELDAEIEASEDNRAEGSPTVIPPIYMPGSERRENRPAGLRIAAGIAAIVLLGGSAALAWNFMSSDTSEPPTILASQDPVKVKPEDTGGKVVPNQDQSVYTAVDGKDDATPKQDALKDTSEKPIAVAKAPSAVAQPAKTTGGASADGSPGAGSPDPQTTGGPIVAPRRVRTVVVRPDGTILTKASTAKPEADGQQDIALATSSEAPTPVSVKTTTQAPATDSGTLASEPDTQIAAVPQETPAKPAVELKPVTAKPVAAPKAAEPTPEAKPAAVAKKPEPKPVKVTKVEPPKPVVKKPVETTAADPLAPVASSSPYKVQVSSQRSPEAAQQSYNSLARRFAGIIGGKGVDYQKTKVKGRDYVRVRIPAQSKAEAQTMCSQLKANGGDCFVTR